MRDFVVVCILLLTVKLCVCFQLIEVVTTHPGVPSLSHTLQHRCMLMSLDDLLVEPDGSIPLRLYFSKS